MTKFDDLTPHGRMHEPSQMLVEVNVLNPAMFQRLEDLSIPDARLQVPEAHRERFDDLMMFVDQERQDFEQLNSLLNQKVCCAHVHTLVYTEQQ